MKKRNWTDKMLRFLRLVYLKLFRINDSPHRIAFGFGLGIFLGILPGTGPIAALLLSILFRVNRASALLGAFLTNTWLSVVTLFVSIRIGSSIFGLDWQKEYAIYAELVKNFHWQNFFKISVLKIFLPVMLGFLIVSFCLGCLSYVIIRAVLLTVGKNKPKKIINILV